ncbi:gamma-glutamyltranspeptidase [Microstroma glucosiphilum]|uniref:Glutathione hydrolase n=1 Tax=Pseudomicrostroma glucosiphilum TaxID=1684307 RepID=A0A316UBI9_9BASI|nr:gamma-glutamyltranspeptidase [Pseudomicrostroma glucosiphilum]PWN22597.1 gamma-glutamyltranspeptidase [Pseudomicrostroma glucosiphilum]
MAATAAIAIAAPGTSPSQQIRSSSSPLSISDLPLTAYLAPSQGHFDEHGPLGKQGVVSSEVDLCSNVGADMLLAGGSAADAVISTALCVGSIDSFHSGIGGGGHILVRSGKGKVTHIDMRETMPAAGYVDIFVDHGANSSILGGLAVGVPGEIRGWEKLHEKYGKLPWKELFQPAITINKKGFKVPNQLATAIAESKAYVCDGSYFAESYCPNGTIAVEGQTITRPRYAKALTLIAERGPSAFYQGTLANSTISAVQSSGGIMTLEDLEGYQAIERTPVKVEFNGYQLYATSAPSSGAVVLSALQTLNQYDDRETAGYDLITHRLIEATKFGYGERTNYADPAYVKNVTRLQSEYLKVSRARAKRDLIKDNAVRAASVYDPSNSAILNDAGTSQIVAADASGLTITLTTTVNTYFGSKVMTDYGIILNNEMDDFSSPASTNSFGYAPSEANYVAGGKRPLSSIAALIAEDAQGNLKLATGSAGGSRIITAIIQNTYHVLQSGMDIQSALDQPRWHNQLSPDVTNLEWAAPADGISEAQAVGAKAWRGFSNSTADFLKSVGHNVTFVVPGSSTAQGLEYYHKQGLFYGGAEVRQIAAAAAAV